jgi:hypothetical protein
MMFAGIILNNVRTIEPCPQMCGNNAVCEHGHDDKGKRRHLWSCPACGDCFSIVCDACPDCDAPVRQEPSS